MTTIYGFKYGPPGCVCECLCCDYCEFCVPYRESGLFQYNASGMNVRPGKEEEAFTFIRNKGHNPEKVLTKTEVE